MTTRVKYTGSTPGADSSTYVIFDSTVAFPGANFVQGAGLKRISIRFDHIYTGTVNMYRSVNRGGTWTQVMQQVQSAPDTTQSSYFDVSVEAFADFKVEWVNGGTAQNPWSVDIALTPDSDPVFTFEDEIASLGAIAHFDPSWGASDDGTTSTWVDRIGGHVVASTSQATRMTYSASAATLNGRPGWTGVVASSTRLVSSTDALAAAIDGSQAITVYSVAVMTGNATAQTVWCVGHASAADQYRYCYRSTSGVQVVAAKDSGAAATLNTGVIQVLTAPFVTSCVYSGAAVTSYDNGGLAISGADAKAPACDRFSVGSYVVAGGYGQHLGGVIGDIIVFPTAHTANERRYVEQLIAAKYDWPVLQGLSGFTNSNFLNNTGLTSGIRGDDTNGVWVEALIRPDAVPGAGTQYIESSWVGLQGKALYAAAANLAMYTLNGTVATASPSRTIAAADVGKLMLFGGTAGPGNLARTFINSAEVGAGSALTGYQKTSLIAYSVGARASVGPASSFSIFSIIGGDVEQTLANHQARAAAIKAAGSFVATGGATPTHAWALTDDRPTYSDLVGSDALTRNGTPTRAQIIVTSWPW